MTTQKLQRIIGFSDLQAFQDCPRKWAISQNWATPKPFINMFRGSIFHDICSQFYDQSFKWSPDKHVPGFNSLRSDDMNDIKEAMSQAKQMAQTYLSSEFTQGIKAVSVDKQLVFKDSIGDIRIGGHPDIVAIHNGKYVLIEFKTGDRPDPVSYNLSGQSDYYALLWNEQPENKDKQISYIYLDLVSEKGQCTRHQRPPNRAAGEYILYQLQVMASQVDTEEKIKQHYGNPHYSGRCAWCSSLKVSQAMDNGDDWPELLEKYYIFKATGERR